MCHIQNTWVSHMQDTGHDCVTWVSHIQDTGHDCVTWVSHIQDTRYDCVTWVSHIQDTGHDCVPWVSQIQDTGHDCVPWVSHIQDTTHDIATWMSWNKALINIAILTPIIVELPGKRVECDLNSYSLEIALFALIINARRMWAMCGRMWDGGMVVYVCECGTTRRRLPHGRDQHCWSSRSCNRVLLDPYRTWI